MHDGVMWCSMVWCGLVCGIGQGVGKAWWDDVRGGYRYIRGRGGVVGKILGLFEGCTGCTMEGA